MKVAGGYWKIRRLLGGWGKDCEGGSARLVAIWKYLYSESTSKHTLLVERI